jgi:hypothetical protein
MNLPLAILHIAGGSAALASGATALACPKGGRLHARAGTVFVASMMLMTTSSIVLALLKPDRVSAGTGFFTLYLVATSWMTARGDGTAGRLERLGFLWACCCTALYAALGVLGSAAPRGHLDGIPAVIAFVFAGIAGLAAAFDLSFLIRGRLSGKQRITRHLWRMCTALLIAAPSFFLGQQKVMPLAIRGSPLLYLPLLAILGSMVFWIFKTRFPSLFRRRSGVRVASAA